MSRKATSQEDRVRRSVKQIDYWVDSIENDLVECSGYLDARARVRDVAGTVRVIVRIRRADAPYKWAMAVLVNNQRIDGIDWEPVIQDHRGKKHDCSGWHRHIWKPKTGDKLKECLPHFNPATVQDFVLGGFKILNVQLRRGEAARGHQMRFN